MRPLIDRKTVAEQLGVSVRTIKRWTDDGRLPCVRPTKQTIRYRVEDVEKIRRFSRPLVTLAAALLLTLPVQAEPIGARLIDAVAFVESNHNHDAVGDAGAARSAWQLHRAAWADASAYLRRHGHPSTTYDKGVNDPATARTHAAAYLGLTNALLKKRLGREPNAGQLYAAYNLGVGGFAKRGFDLSRCPTITRRAVAKLRKRMEVSQ